MSGSGYMPAYIDDIEEMSSFARRYTIRPLGRTEFPAFEAGSNIEVGVLSRPGDEPTPYSITSTACRSDYYQIIVVNNSGNRSGKNSWMNANARIGDRIEVSAPKHGLHFQSDDESAYFVAGGSGIAAFLSYFSTVVLTDKNYTIDHVVRDRYEVIEYLERSQSDFLTINTLVTSEHPDFDIKKILSGKDTTRPMYISGSGRFINDVIESALGVGWRMENLRWDRFALPDNAAAASGLSVQ